MDTVIVAFESDSLCRKFRDLLEGSGSAACLICHSGSQVRRAAAAQPIYCVVCGTRLSDGPAEWLCGDLHLLLPADGGARPPAGPVL